MARTRNLKPAFFKNEDLAECDPMTRLLFAGLWTLADRSGRLEDRPKRIKAELFPYDNCDIDSMLATLRGLGFVVSYEVEGQKYLEIPTFSQHQHPHPSEKETCPPPQAVKNNCKSLTCNVPATDQQRTDRALYLVPSTSHLAPCESPSQPADAGCSEKKNEEVSWDSSKGWQGITDADRDAWAAAYPACDVRQELAQSDQWLRANPRKARRSNWRHFLTGWLSRKQDRGGSRTGQGQPATTPKEARKFWRAEFDRKMTDAEYAAAMRARRATGSVSLDLSRKLTAEVKHAS